MTYYRQNGKYPIVPMFTYDGMLGKQKVPIARVELAIVPDGYHRIQFKREDDQVDAAIFIQVPHDGPDAKASWIIDLAASLAKHHGVTCRQLTLKGKFDKRLSTEQYTAVDLSTGLARLSMLPKVDGVC